MTVGEKRSENMSSGEDCKKLVADLASQFYDLGWFPGSGGSLTKTGAFKNIPAYSVQTEAKR